MARSEDYAELDDEALAAICAQRPANEEAWVVFYMRFRTPVPRRLRKLGFSAADVEDLTQEVFFQVFQFLPSFKPGGAPLEALIFQFTNHVAINQWRRRAMEGRTVSLRDDLYHAAAH